MITVPFKLNITESVRLALPEFSEACFEEEDIEGTFTVSVVTKHEYYNYRNGKHIIYIKKVQGALYEITYEEDADYDIEDIIEFIENY